jgi:hypothetical protein
MEQVTETIEPVVEIEEEIDELFIEPYSDTDYIGAAYNSLAAISDIDVGMMTKNNVAKINRIKRQSIRIISHCLNNLYEELFDNSVDGSDD